jgi:ribonuclease Y
MIENAVLLLVGLGAGIGLGLLIKGKVAAGKIRDAEAEAARIVSNAEREAETKLKEALLEAKDKLYQSRADIERENREKRQELQNQERRLTQKEENLEKKIDGIDKREADAVRRERELTAREKVALEKEERYEKGLRDQREMLEKIASMTAEEAKRQLMVSMEDEAKYEAAKAIKRIEDEAKEEADKKAKNIISMAIQRYSSDYVAEATVSLVNLPNDEMKGRIIGREGRNIRALEAATGIDLIIDDTPEAVILSCYDPLRREIARLTIERLIQDGRIHPARIEEIAEKV